jgi:uncharacterized protein
MLKEMAQNSDADLNKVDYLGRAPIHVAAGHNGNLEVCKYLTEQSINIDQLDYSGRSALFMAIVASETEIVHHLQEKGATAIGSESKFAKILCTVGFEGDLEKLKLLHKCEVNLELSDYDQRNIAHLAACEGHVNLLEFLITETTFDF